MDLLGISRAHATWEAAGRPSIDHLLERVILLQPLLLDNGIPSTSCKRQILNPTPLSYNWTNREP